MQNLKYPVAGIALALLAAVPAAAQLIAVATQAPPDAEADSGTGGETCVGILFSATGLIFVDGFESGDTTSWGAPNAQFPATGVLDLDVEVRFDEDFAGDHVLHLKMTTPKGHHYQTLSVPISPVVTRQSASRRVEGYPRPLPVSATRQVLHLGEPASAVTMSFPVGGTAIVSSALYGQWTAEAYLDDSTAACFSASFMLNP